jgi:hypothetical protein
MHTYTLAIAAAAALFFVPISASSQTIRIGPGGIRIGGGSGECEQLRLACEHKEELGEQGEGNCRRYRETCRR